MRPFYTDALGDCFLVEREAQEWATRHGRQVFDVPARDDRDTRFWRVRGVYTEQTDQGAQIVLPGTSRSAHQAVAARGQKITARKPRREPGGMFDTPEEKQGVLL